MRFREGGAGDYAAVASLWRRADAHRRGLDIDDPAIFSVSYVEGRLPLGWFYVALEGGEIVGVTRASPAREDFGNGAVINGLVHISFVAVDPAHWGKRIAGSLMEQTLAGARERGFARAQLWMHVGNTRAHRLYTRFGFAPAGEIREDQHGTPMELYRLPAL